MLKYMAWSTTISIYRSNLMSVGTDFFIWLKFAIELIKIIVKIFGDDEAKQKAEQNGFV